MLTIQYIHASCQILLQREMGTDFKKVKVKFLNGTRFKVVTLPKTSEHSDLKNLKEQLLAEMVFDDSIVAIGGSKGSCAGDLVLFYFDEEFAEDVEVPRDMPLTHLTTLTLKHCGSRSGKWFRHMKCLVLLIIHCLLL